MRFGFNNEWWPTLANNLDWLQRLGCDCVRFPVAVPEDGNFPAIYETLRSRGLRPYIVLGGWNPAPDPATYAEWVAPFADRYREATLCLWNEPNLSGEGSESPVGGNPLSVQEAIALNLAGRGAARQANPDVRVLYSSVSPVGSWERYQDQLYSALPRGDVAIHCYPGGRMEGRLEKVRDQYRRVVKYGRVHVTEIDMAAPWLGDRDAPKLAGKAFDLLEKLGAETVIFHSIDNHRREAGELKRRE